MRHIRFRGKILNAKGLLNAGDWIEGGYYRDDCYGGCPKGKHYIISFNSAFGGYNDMTEVDGETVGEWTGIRDMNGTLIFEGDIAKHIEPESEENPAIEEVGIVEWDSKGASFLHTCKNGSNTTHWLLSTDYMKVIGNIHDYHELVKS